MISRRPGLTEAQFREHWRSVHGVHASKMPGLRWYRQNHIVARYFEVEPWPLQAVDGLSQLQFDSIKAMEEAERSEAYAATKRDIPNFQGSITILAISPVGTAPRSREGLSKAILLARCEDGNHRGHDLRAKAMTDLVREIPGLVATQYNAVVDKAHPVAAGVPSGEPNVDAFIELLFADDDARATGAGALTARGAFWATSALSPIALYGVEEYIVV